MGSRIRPLPLLVLGAVGVVLAEATRSTGEAYWVRVIGFPLVFIAGYLLVSIASAQIRARAQPFSHTLILRDEEIEVRDRLRGRTATYPWADFERVEVTPRYFSIRRREAPRGESYLIDRQKLSADEQTFLGQRIIEL